jgi:hypothetical protein
MVQYFQVHTRRVIVLLGWLLANSTCAVARDVRINELQFIGSHNSYHAGFAPSEAEFMRSHSPDSFAGLNYSHPSLTRQLNDGVRQIELDIFADREGGRFARPACRRTHRSRQRMSWSVPGSKSCTCRTWTNAVIASR